MTRTIWAILPLGEVGEPGRIPSVSPVLELPQYGGKWRESERTVRQEVRHLPWDPPPALFALQYAHICDPGGSPPRRRFSPGGDGQGPRLSARYASPWPPQQPQESIQTRSTIC